MKQYFLLKPIKNIQLPGDPKPSKPFPNREYYLCKICGELKVKAERKACRDS